MLQILVAIFLSIVTSPVFSQAQPQRYLQLKDKLDRPIDGYCLDVVGSGKYIRLDMPHALIGILSLVLLLANDSAFATASKPTPTVNPSATQQQTDPGLLSVLKALLFGNSGSWIHTLTLGDAARNAQQICRYELKSAKHQRLNLPKGADTPIIVESLNALWFVHNAKLYRSGLDEQLTPGKPVKVELPRPTQFSTLVGAVDGSQPQLLGLDKAKQRVLSVNLKTLEIESHKVIVDDAALAVLDSESVHRKAGHAIAEIPFSGSAQIKILPNNDQPGRQLLVSRLRGGEQAPVLVTPRFSAAGQYLSYRAACARENCCVHR